MSEKFASMKHNCIWILYGLNKFVINSESSTTHWCFIKERNEIKALPLESFNQEGVQVRIFHALCVFHSLYTCFLNLSMCLLDGCLKSLFLCLCLSLTKGFTMYSLNKPESIRWRRNGMVYTENFNSFTRD